MPVKNAASYLTECLDSIVGQSYTNWELYAVDDHSSDSSFRIIDNYARVDKRVHIFKNNGTGIIPALQLGYRHCQGKYITRMDADDIMPRHKLASLYQILQQRGNGHIAVGKVEYFSAHSLGEGYKSYAQWLNNLTVNEANFEEIYKECSIPSPCWMVSRADFEKCDGFNPSTYPEDYDLAFRFRIAGLKVAGVNEILHKWRDHPERASRNDENYADNRFLPLKIRHFIDQDYQMGLPLLLWGAGPKGKYIARSLISNNVPFEWITNNGKKMGHSIYETTVKSMSLLDQKKSSQVIVGISSNVYDAEIKEVSNAYPQHQFFKFS